MYELLDIVTTVLSGISIILLAVVIKKLGADKGADVAYLVQQEFRNMRNDSLEESRGLREEIAGANKAVNETVVNTINQIGNSQQKSIEAVENRIKSLTDSNIEKLDKLRKTIEEQMKAIQESNESRIDKMNKAITQSIDEMKQSQKENLETVENRIKSIASSNENRLDKLKDTIEKKMSSLQESNEKKLEEMRQTVDEKLQSTLEKRLGESFKLVSERLEAVQRGLGDMQNLATGVGDLKRVLTNVKTRGTWAEYQIGDVLEQILSPEQFAKNVQPKPGSSETVEYAIRLPGQSESSNVWLPIDSKFPQEDYQRLVDAAEIADAETVGKSTASLIKTIKTSAKEISEKYIEPPHTTDFAIMFLPTEGLYSEVLRQPKIVEQLQQQFRIVVAGPTTLAAILNSLRMGFRTLAIEKRSSEVWNVLSAVKTEFGKFADVFKKIKKQLDAASNTIDSTGVRTRAMARKLQEVEALPADESARLLGLDSSEYIEASENAEEKIV